ncbi:DNA-binding protein [Alteromonas sp. RW2A1]|uniref:DNA-binding protein n=1 Tax=Alteromonas sp. RW2A1 TaxID=1917158 RepID=UPI0018DB73C5|nr:DNA-binding protein [Alteromonas sp. RW2A1]
MARAGVTLEAVKQAREALMARGDSVSIDPIRFELGNTGSKSTLLKHLKALEQDDTKQAKCPQLLIRRLIAAVVLRLKNEANEA